MFTQIPIIFILLFGKSFSSDDIEKKDLVLIETEESSSSNAEGAMDFEEGDLDVFEATHEWKTIKEGQAIPRGLHVQMNLQTGEKQAKLMDGNNMKVGKTEKKEAVNVDETRKEKFVKMNDNILSKEKLKTLLKDFKDKFKEEDLNDEVNLEHEKNKYRNMDELKQEFEGTDIWMKKDIEIIQELVEKLNNSHSYSKAEILEALDDLEYFVHQIDNARDLAVLQGYDILLRLLNQSDHDVKSKAAFVIGAAAQSNLPVQIILLESGIISLLIREVCNYGLSIPTRKNMIYALSSILRIFPKGTQHFMKIGGISALTRLYQEEGNDILKIRSLTLVVDLLTEQMENIQKKAKDMRLQDYEKATLKAPLFKVLFQNGWCDLVTTFPITTDNETREKILQAIDTLFPVCKTTFRENNLKSSLHLWRIQWHKEITMDNEDDTGYLGSLVELLDKIVNKL